MQDQVQTIVDKALEMPLFRAADSFEASEREIYQPLDRLGDLIVQHHLQTVSDADAVRQTARQLAQGTPSRVRNQGLRSVNIQTLRAGTITVTTPYFSRNCDTHKPSRGCYPVLVLLGIHGCRPRVTPALANHVVLTVTAMGSMDEARLG